MPQEMFAHGNVDGLALELTPDYNVAPQTMQPVIVWDEGFGIASVRCHSETRRHRCSPECSLHHRQRVYWQKRGKKLRKKRATRRQKMGK